jgi:Flp pilus assembly protein TadB
MQTNLDLTVAFVAAALGAGALAFLLVRSLFDVQKRIGDSGAHSFRFLLTPFRGWAMKRRGISREVDVQVSRYEKDILRTGGRFLGGADAYEVYAARFVLPVLAMLVAFVLAALLRPFSGLILLTGAVFAALLHFWPEQALRDMAQKRTNRFTRELPPALDVMCLVTQSGGDLTGAIQGVIDVTPPGPVREELGRAMAEVAIGESLAQALNHVADRIDTPDATAVFSTLAQALEMGTSVSDNLSAAAALIRKNARIRAQEKAQKAVVAMTFPLLLLILPGVFIVLFAPLVIQYVMR